MFWFFSEPEAAAKAGEHAAAATKHASEGGDHHTPVIVEFVNHYLGPTVHKLQLQTTKRFWDWFFNWASPGTSAEDVFGTYTPENAIPWYTVMFVIACILSVVVIWVLKPKKLSEDEPNYGQLTLEAGMLQIRSLLLENVGPNGMKYMPIIATFAVLILISNLMGLIPGLMSPTAAISVTFALGITSFVYYNAIGIRENGLLGHLRHFGGPITLLIPLMFVVELISNFVRPISLGVRLFGNMYSDEQVLGTISGLVSGLIGAPWILPVILMPLSLFVAFMQTFIFVLLSIIYISEVTHHEEHHDDEHGHDADGPVAEPAHA
jgi:F-type H+-transporting ATPase subunit a